MQTIAAIATPPGTGALAVLRLSGPDALAIADRVARPRRGDPPSRWPSGVQRLARIVDGDRLLDEAMVSVHRAPRSYTGEDVVEISCHGGALLTRLVLDTLLRAGAAMAGPGEFSRRAFLNGKMDLTRAEAVMDLIAAQTARAARAAVEQLEGRLGEEIERVRADLLALVARLEAHIDFPEEEIGAGALADLGEAMAGAGARVARLLGTAERGRILREGVRVAICGAPNAGKSSLLNRLLGFERAIVDERPGTTRDYLEETIDLDGIPVCLVDMAGLRDAGEDVEREGIVRARRMIERSDVVLEVIDATLVPGAAVLPLPSDPIRILNKIDLGEHAGWHAREGTRVSCRTGSGIDALRAALRARIERGAAAWEEDAVAINARHAACLRRAGAALGEARAALERGVEAELVAVDLRAALDAVGDVVGRVGPEDVLGEIFARFCVGK